MLHRLLFPWLKAQLAHAQALWVQDRASGRNGVFMPHAQERKYLRAGESWAWFWVFPSHKLSIDPQTEVERRHHLFEERLNRQLKKAVALAGTDICTVQELLGHSAVSTIMIYTHVLKVAAGGTVSPLDLLAQGC